MWLQAVMDHLCLGVWLKHMTLFPDIIATDSFRIDEALCDDSGSVGFYPTQPLIRCKGNPVRCGNVVHLARLFCRICVQAHVDYRGSSGT